MPCQQIHFWHEKWSTDFEDGKDNIPTAKSGDLRQFSLCSECYPLEEEAGEPEGSSAAEQASTDYGINGTTPGIGKGDDWKKADDK